jgi:hypothetical protein
MYKKIL